MKKTLRNIRKLIRPALKALSASVKTRSEFILLHHNYIKIQASFLNYIFRVFFAWKFLWRFFFSFTKKQLSLSNNINADVFFYVRCRHGAIALFFGDSVPACKQQCDYCKNPKLVEKQRSDFHSVCIKTINLKLWLK